MMEGVRFRRETPGERKSVHKRKKERKRKWNTARLERRWWEFGVLEMHWYAAGLTLCDPVGSRPPGSSFWGILQARTLEWVAMPSSRDLPNPGVESAPLASPALAGRFFTTIPECHLWDAVSFLKIEQLLAFESYTISQCTHLTTC